MKTDFGERIAKIESKLDVFESMVRKELTAKAQELLATSNVQVALVNQQSDNFFPISGKEPSLPIPGATGEKELFATYEVEAIRNKSLIFRTQVEEVSHGKVTRILYQQRAEILLPLKEKRAYYDFRLEDDKGALLSPPIRLEIVILEQVSPDTLVVAIGLKPAPEEKRA